MDIKARFQSLIKSIPKDARIGILHDTDADGICSGVLAAKGLEKVLGHPELFFLHEKRRRVTISPATLHTLKTKKLTYLFTTDKPVDQDPQSIQQAEKYSTVVIFDHHQQEHDVTSDKTLLIKPPFFTSIPPSQYPTSKLVYDFFLELGDMQDYDWLAVAGLISDAAYPTWKSFVDGVHAKYGLSVPEQIFSSPLATVGKYISSAATYDEKNIDEAVAIAFHAKAYTDILSSHLKTYDDKIRVAIEQGVAHFEKNAEYYPDIHLYWYDLSSQYPISSPVSTIVSMARPHETVVVAEKRGTRLGLSLRRQDKAVNCIELVRAALVGVDNANGGGHIPAAGGQAPYHAKEKIKQQMMAYLHLR